MKNTAPELIFFTFLLLIGCKSERQKDSILNKDNYTINPTSFVRSEMANQSEIYCREKIDVDIIPTTTVLIPDDMGSPPDAFIDFKLFSYTDDCAIVPGISIGHFMDCSSLGEIISYKVESNPEFWRSLLAPSPDIKESPQYGKYCVTKVSNLVAPGKWEEVLVTPMAYSFINEHDYNDKREVVRVTISYDKEIGDTPKWMSDLIPHTKKIESYSRTIFCLADYDTCSIIQYNYDKIITDTRPYYIFRTDWGPLLKE